jgi:hypothetical protein
MFSEQYDVDEAAALVKKVPHYFFTDEFNYGIENLNRKTGLTLEPLHIRKTCCSVEITEDGIARLRQMLEKRV